MKQNLLGKNKLRFLYFNITNNCNLKCFYCYDEENRRSKKEFLNMDKVREVAKDCKKLDLEYVTITGGEPLLHKQWFEIAKTFYDEGVDVSISTNGLLLSDQNIKNIVDLKASLQISLDGFDDMMEFISKGKNVYTKIMNNLNKLKENDVYVLLNCVVGKHNIDLIEEFMKEQYNQNNRTRFTFFSESLSSEKEYALNIKEKYDLIMKVNDFNIANNTDLFRMTLTPLMTPPGIKMTMQAGCGWAYTTCALLYNGDVTVCAPASGVKGLVAGNVNDDNFENIWSNSKLFTELRENTFDDLKGVCALCPIKEQCVGGCRLASYIEEADQSAPNTLCQDFYNAVLNGEIESDMFPIGCVKVGI